MDISTMLFRIQILGLIMGLVAAIPTTTTHNDNQSANDRDETDISYDKLHLPDQFFGTQIPSSDDHMDASWKHCQPFKCDNDPDSLVTKELIKNHESLQCVAIRYIQRSFSSFLDLSSLILDLIDSMTTQKPNVETPFNTATESELDQKVSLQAKSNSEILHSPAIKMTEYSVPNLADMNEFIASGFGIADAIRDENGMNDSSSSSIIGKSIKHHEKILPKSSPVESQPKPKSRSADSDRKQVSDPMLANGLEETQHGEKNIKTQHSQELARENSQDEHATKAMKDLSSAMLLTWADAQGDDSENDNIFLATKDENLIQKGQGNQDEIIEDFEGRESTSISGSEDEIVATFGEKLPSIISSSPSKLEATDESNLANVNAEIEAQNKLTRCNKSSTVEIGKKFDSEVESQQEIEYLWEDSSPSPIECTHLTTSECALKFYEDYVEENSPVSENLTRNKIMNISETGSDFLSQRSNNPIVARNIQNGKMALSILNASGIPKIHELASTEESSVSEEFGRSTELKLRQLDDYFNKPIFQSKSAN